MDFLFYFFFFYSEMNFSLSRLFLKANNVKFSENHYDNREKKVIFHELVIIYFTKLVNTLKAVGGVMIHKTIYVAHKSYKVYTVFVFLLLLHKDIDALGGRSFPEAL